MAPVIKNDSERQTASSEAELLRGSCSAIVGFRVCCDDVLKKHLWDYLLYKLSA